MRVSQLVNVVARGGGSMLTSRLTVSERQQLLAYPHGVCMASESERYNKHCHRDCAYAHIERKCSCTPFWTAQTRRGELGAGAPAGTAGGEGGCDMHQMGQHVIVCRCTSACTCTVTTEHIFLHTFHVSIGTAYESCIVHIGTKAQ